MSEGLGLAPRPRALGALPQWLFRALLDLEARAFPDDAAAASEQGWRQALGEGLGDREFERLLLLVLEGGVVQAYSSVGTAEDCRTGGALGSPAEACGESGLWGLAYMRRLFEDVELLTIAVAAPARRRGLGRQLLQTASQYWWEQGAQRLLLEVDVQNQAALALYRGQGFRNYGQRRNYYGPGRHAALLEKGLTEREG